MQTMLEKVREPTDRCSMHAGAEVYQVGGLLLPMVTYGASNTIYIYQM